MTDIEKEKYPTAEVISGYLLMGGACGGAIIGFFFGLGLTLVSPLLLIIVPIIAIFYGAVAGLIPALLTGIIIAMLKIRENGWQVALIGGGVSLLCILLYYKKFDGVTVVFTLTGATSAVIVGKYALPKSTD